MTQLTDKNTITPVCLECGGNLGPGRDDRKFCSDPCRTGFNNQKRRDKQDGKSPLSSKDYIVKIQQILLNNRQLLLEICPEDQVKKMQKRDLEGRGFNFKYFTSESPSKNQHIYRFCFELGYRDIDDGEILIIHRDREVIC
jgi:hypothetical protein